ncbi:hypothetical protein [Arthrobacter sp. B3I4]|uniref:hypothetical protein n=1 Tax=Arthrobacter sp. B3I4 TaxID=3042267 RepID=UPI0027853DBB|nr:hypothetical protein [Arthrobacter sp. B3I4]MDQ0754258.1 hypothetical protein [Arthrobacter sp. B3I4]
MRATFSGAAGQAFAAVFKAIKAFRPDRPIHPSGVALVGTVEKWPGSAAPRGISWIDSAGTDAVSARFSRSVGTPSRWPDILGLALRINTEDGPADVLLASTPLSWPGRLLLTAHRDADNRTFSSLMPYKGSRGPVLLAVRSEPTGHRLPAALDGFREALGTGAWTLGVYSARPTGPWTRFGTLTLSLAPDTKDTAARFDPLNNVLPGARTYPWASRLRRPSYAAARRPVQ